MFEINADYLRGFFDGEGFLQQARVGQVQLVLSNTQKELMEAIHAWLVEQSYSAKLTAEKPKLLTKTQAYRIDIQEYWSVEKWFAEIGSNRSDMWTKWGEIREGKHRPKRINYPIYRKRPA